MGDSITEGTVVEILPAIGSYVQMDEVVCVLETDKVGCFSSFSHEGPLARTPFSSFCSCSSSSGGGGCLGC